MQCLETKQPPWSREDEKHIPSMGEWREKGWLGSCSMAEPSFGFTLHGGGGGGGEPCFAQLPLSFPRLQPDMVISWSHHHGSCHRLTISGTQGSARILGEHLSRAPRRKLIPGNRTDCQGPLKKGKKETEFNYPNHR